MFLNDDFLLTTDFAKALFHDYAKDQRIIDFHCHLNPQTIYENQAFRNPTQAWLFDLENGSPVGDHYKWRLMRANGADEASVTGSASDYEKFEAFASCLEKAYGNPIFEWSHLELKRFFGIDDLLTSQSAKSIWDKMQASLETEALLPRNILKQVKTEVVVTTDDPIDDLRFQKALAEEEKAFKVIPAWRPDRLFNIFTKDYIDYIAKLSQVSEIAIANLDDLLGAIIKRLDYFQAAGASISDHGLEVFYYAPATAAEVDEIFQERLAGERLTSKQIAQFHTYIQKFLAKEYAKRNWVMQMHISAFRNLNTPAFQRTGINTGHDALNDLNIAQNVANFFDALEIEGDQAGEDYVPRTILYSLNENDYVPLLAIGATHLQGLKGAGAFQKFQLGSAWWFNDTREGMRRQLTKFMEGTLLGNFVGMLTDSRSLLSYTRHEYFRRVLCELLGELEARGQIPNALNLIGPLVENVSHHNAKQFFNV